MARPRVTRGQGNAAIVFGILEIIMGIVFIINLNKLLTVSLIILAALLVSDIYRFNQFRARNYRVYTVEDTWQVCEKLDKCLSLYLL